MAVSDKAKSYAKVHNWSTFMVSIDSSTKSPQGDKIAADGALDPESEEELRAWFARWAKRTNERNMRHGT